MSLVRLSLVLACLPLVVLGNACSKTEADPPAASNGGSGRGGATGQGGSGSGRGGDTGSGGMTANGGAGNPGAGGATGQGGTPGSGNGSGGSGSGGSMSGADAGAGGATGMGGASADAAAPGEKFSFFAASMAAMNKLAKNEKGFGGDLRYGQADGVSGGDKICTEIAEMALPGSGAKGWRAFLSAEKGPDGKPVNAIDRVGNGPWYDRKGRLFAMNKASLVGERPMGIDAAIRDDFPNENGVLNSRPVPNGPRHDNHHFLTGSNTDGTLMGTNTCNSWTSTMTTPSTRPRIGFSFIAGNRRHWISGQTEGGCGAGIVITDGGGSDPSNPIVGSGGGYGGIYCFALQP